MSKTNNNDFDFDEIGFSGSFEFEKPINFEGETYTQVEFNLNELTARDLINTRKEAFKVQNEAETIFTDDILHAMLVARSAKLPGIFVFELSASEFGAWATLGQFFLASGVSRFKGRG